MSLKVVSNVSIGEITKTGLVIPKKVMQDIGLGFRKHRIEKMTQGLNLGDLSPMEPLKPKTVARKVKKGAALPAVPLMDTQNMSRGTNINASDSRLEITQGATREEIVSFHQNGTEHLPQRVSLSFNEEFVNKVVYPMIANHYRKVVRSAFRGRA